MKRIFIVDEDKNQLRSFINELEIRNIEVVHYENATDFKNDIENGATADMAFIDVMLSPGNEFSQEETKDYLVTGPVLARKLRQTGFETPIVFFTHAAQTQILDYVAGTIEQIGNAALLRKRDFPNAFIFGDTVEKLLTEGLEKSGFQKFLSAISESISFNVKAGPVGIDLKKAANPNKGLQGTSALTRRRP